MYYSEKVRKRKIKELEGDSAFMEYARKSFDERVMIFEDEKTFEEYLLKNVCTLHDNCTLLRFMETADQKTINKVMNEALKGL